MKNRHMLTLLLFLLVLPVIGLAQVDNFGKLDTIYAELAPIDQFNWSITISMTNDEDIEGLSVPLHLSAGRVKVVADSAVYKGGRMENFTYKGFRPDTAIQCATLGMVANLGPTQIYLNPGSGRLVTIFVSSLDKEPIERLKVDTTTTQPNNSLMAIASRFQHGEITDTIPFERRKELEIIPAFVVRQPE